jgi:predicted DNA binding protein
MGLFEVVLKVSHDCPFCNFSSEFPKVKIFSWCNGEHDVIEFVLEDINDLPKILDRASMFGDVIESSSNSQNIQILTRKCACECSPDKAVTPNFEIYNILKIPPDIYHKGWEYYRLICFQSEDLTNLCEKLRKTGFKYEILRKIPFEGSISSSLTLTADALFANLTEKQMDALLTAFNNGYYGVPRRTDVKTIANRKNVPRTTFTEHLRKAETKIITSLVPYIQLFSKTSIPKRKPFEIKLVEGSY